MDKLYTTENALKSNKDKGNANKNIKSKKNKDKKNPWDYKTELPVLFEPQKLDQDEVAVLCCREQYRIKPVKYQEPKQGDDAVYKMFGDLVGQSVEFIRCWLRCHILTHKKTVNKLAGEYLKSKGMKISTWFSCVHTG